MTQYIRLPDAVRVIERLGFSFRDVGLLSAALARPSTSLGGIDAYPSLDRKAAALIESIVRNHPLIDGNKRCAWTLFVVFLRINGFSHDFSTDEAFDLIVGVAEGALGLDEVETTISAHLVPRH